MTPGYSVFCSGYSVFCSGQVLFNKDDCLHKYETAADILREFFEVRREYYVKRKKYLVEQLEHETTKLQMKARFIREVVEGTLVVNRQKKQVVESKLKETGYVAFPKIKAAGRCCACCCQLVCLSDVSDCNMLLCREGA